jgi:hypothetical protein
MFFTDDPLLNQYHGKVIRIKGRQIQLDYHHSECCKKIDSYYGKINTYGSIINNLYAKTRDRAILSLTTWSNVALDLVMKSVIKDLSTRYINHFNKISSNKEINLEDINIKDIIEDTCYNNFNGLKKAYSAKFNLSDLNNLDTSLLTKETCSSVIQFFENFLAANTKEETLDA